MAKKNTTEFEMPDVSGIDYENLTGDNWKKYQEIETSLFMHQHYDFEQFTARPIRKFRVNEDTGEKEQYMAGIEVTGAKPKMRTRISARDARTMNVQIATNGLYYLLAKTPKVL